MYVSIRLTVIFSTLAMSCRAAGFDAVKRLDGYQCMSLAHQWDGVGEKPAPTKAYAGPGDTDPAVGYVGGIVTVPLPLVVTNDRVPALWPNHRKVWVSRADIVPFHVVTDPNAVCTPAVMSNGTYGTTGKMN